MRYNILRANINPDWYMIHDTLNKQIVVGKFLLGLPFEEHLVFSDYPDTGELFNDYTCLVNTPDYHHSYLKQHFPELFI